MGQRHQVIVVYPAKFYYAGNCNNREVRAEVIHHQWLYGHTAIRTLSRMVTFIKASVTERMGDIRFGTKDGYASDGTEALSAVMSVDPASGYFHNTSVWPASDWNRMEGGETGYVKPQLLSPDMFDNNDGITLIQFEIGQTKPKVCYITPSHLEGKRWKKEKHGKGPWTPREYLAFYYTDRELKSKQFAEYRLEIEQALKNIEENTRAFTVAEVKKLLPLFFKKGE